MYVQCIAKYDQIKFMKDNNGAPIKLEIKEINCKCNLLPTLAKMSKDMDIMTQPSTIEEDNDSDSKLDAKMASEVNQLYYYLRSELAQREECNDKMMAQRYAQEVEQLKTSISEEAAERGNTKFVNLLEDEGSGVINAAA